MRLAVALALAFVTTPAFADFYALLDYARMGELELVRAELSAGTDPNPPDYHDGYSPLQFAAGNGHVDMTQMLLAAGADTEYRDHNGDRPITWASQRDEIETLKLLLAAGSPADAALDPYGRTPLMEAANKGNAEMVRLLLAAGANPNAREQVGDTPLHFAAATQSAHSVRLLIEADANPNVIEEVFYQTPLHKAAEWGNAAIVDALIAGSAVPEPRDRDGKTPLYVAAERGKADVVAALLRRWVDADAADTKGITPLLAAMNLVGYAEPERQQAVLLLAEYTKDLDRAFAAALGARYQLAALRLLSRGASVNAVDTYGYSALANSVRLDGDAVFRDLLARGADLARFGDEALFAAAAFGRTDLAAILIDRGVAVDALNERGATPLLLAAQNAHVETVEFLLAAGAEKVPVDALGFGLDEYMEIVPDFMEWQIDRRSASRAHRPTEHIEIDLKRIRERQAAIRKLLAAQ